MKKLTLLFLILCLITGCTPAADSQVTLYFVEAGGTAIREETRAVHAEGSILETAIRALLDGPRTAGLTRVIPKDTTLLGVKMRGTVAEINLSAPFDEGADDIRLLARYTVIYTACAVSDVNRVQLLVEGQPLTSLRDGTRLGALGKSDLALANPESGTETLLTLYFTDETGTYLLPEARKVSLSEGQSAAEAIVTELVRGPASTHLFATLSPEVRVLSAEIRAGVCFVNVNRAFLEKSTGEGRTEALAVYSIVNSLSALPEISEVHFLVEGQTVERFGQFEFSRGFTENRTLYPPA